MSYTTNYSSLENEKNQIENREMLTGGFIPSLNGENKLVSLEEKNDTIFIGGKKSKNIKTDTLSYDSKKEEMTIKINNWINIDINVIIKEIVSFTLNLRLIDFNVMYLLFHLYMLLINIITAL